MSMFLAALLAASFTMSAVILLLWLVGTFLPRKISAGSRYFMWFIVLAGLLIPFRPSIPVPFEPISFPKLFEPSHKIISVSGSEHQSRERVESSGEAPQTVSVELSDGLAGNLIGKKHPVDYTFMLFGIWMAGASGVLAFHLWTYGKFVSAVRRWGAVTEDVRIRSVLRTVWAEMGLKRKEVIVKTCAFVSSPMLIGFQNPTILLPEKPIASDKLEYIIRHELTHYKRRDIWMNFLFLFALSMHWFNPFIYLMGKMIRTDCETSCDEMVIDGNSIGKRKQYGETIISFIGTQSTRTPILSTYFYGGGSNMKKRLVSIMDTGRKSKFWAGACVLAVTVMTLLSGSAFAASTVQYIGGDKAKTITLSDAGISESQVTAMKIEIDYKNGAAVYDIELNHAQTEYDYKIDAVSGTILSYEQKTRNAPVVGNSVNAYAMGTAIDGAAAEQKALDSVGSGSVVLSETKYKKDGRIEYKVTVVSGDAVYKIELLGDGTLKKMEQDAILYIDPEASAYAGNVISGEDAISAALEKSDGGTVIKCKLDYKKGLLWYEVKIINGGVEHKVKLNPETGAVYDYSFKSK